jgi:N-acetylglucosaminyl-diphospho-decaprenol L-rhamnosyltransferase
MEEHPKHASIGKAQNATLPTVAISIVSHGQTVLVNELLNDIVQMECLGINQIVLTLNIHDEIEPSNWVKLPALQKILVRNSTIKGYGANHNAAFELVSNKNPTFFFVLNPDLRLSSRHLIQNITAAMLTGGFDFGAPSILEAGTIASSARSLYTPWQAFKGLIGLRQRHAEMPVWLAGMFLVISTVAFRSVNGFDENFFLYCEDVDISLRLSEKGFAPHFLHQFQVVHMAQRASHKKFLPMTMHIVSALKLWTSGVFFRHLARQLKRRLWKF